MFRGGGSTSGVLQVLKWWYRGPRVRRVDRWCNKVEETGDRYSGGRGVTRVGGGILYSSKDTSEEEEEEL